MSYSDFFTIRYEKYRQIINISHSDVRAFFLFHARAQVIWGFLNIFAIFAEDFSPQISHRGKKIFYLFFFYPINPRVRLAINRELATAFANLSDFLFSTNISVYINADLLPGLEDNEPNE